MRIAMLSTPHVPTPPKGYGASETIAGKLAEGFVRRGHEVRLFGTDGCTEVVADRRVYPEHRVAATFDQREFIHVGRAIRDVRDCDVVHNHCVVGGPAFAALCPRPFVTTLHYLSPMVAAFPEANYLTISNRQRADAEHLNVVATIYNGVDVDEFPLSRDKDDYLLFLGRFHPNKGADIAIEVARRLGRRLIIAAPEPPDDKRAWFDEKIRPNLGGKIDWIGPVESSKKARLLGRATATLAPIRWEEPFGLVLVESMACGTPPIAFRRGATPELVDNGVTGLLVDTLADMLRAVERAGEINPEACRERVVRHFSLERMLSDHEALYRRLVAAAA